MKTIKIFIGILIVLTFINVNAQIKVVSGGNVGINNTSPGSKLVVKGSGSSSSTSALNITNSGGTSTFYVRDDGNVGIGTTGPDSKLTIYGSTKVNSSPLIHGFILGNSSGVDRWIIRTYNNESGDNTGADFILCSRNDDGSSLSSPIVVQRSTGNVVIGTTALSSYKLYVSGNAYCTGSWSSSDARFKKNITPIDSALSKILKLNGKIYEFRKDEFKDLNFSEGKNLGFLAQDVQEVLPEAVRLDSNGYYSISYDEIIPVLVEAIKQQQKQIETLQTDLSNCCSVGKTNPSDRNNNNIDNPSSTANTKNNTETSKSALLYQNNPNPFSQSTNIKCFIPKESANAALYIYDMQGTQIKKIQINEKENVNIIIQGFELKAGMYMYTLIIDGKEIGTKKMILTD